MLLLYPGFKGSSCFSEVDILLVSEDNSQPRDQLVGEYFVPAHPHQDTRGIKGGKLEMCDHQEKENKHGKAVSVKSQHVKQHHQNQGHHHQHHHHQSNDNKAQE